MCAGERLALVVQIGRKNYRLDLYGLAAKSSHIPNRESSIWWTIFVSKFITNLYKYYNARAKS